MTDDGEKSDQKGSSEEDQGVADLSMIESGAQSIAEGFGVADQLAEAAGLGGRALGLVVDHYYDAAVDIDG